MKDQIELLTAECSRLEKERDAAIESARLEKEANEPSLSETGSTKFLVALVLIIVVSVLAHAAVLVGGLILSTLCIFGIVVLSMMLIALVGK